MHDAHGDTALKASWPSLQEATLPPAVNQTPKLGAKYVKEVPKRLITIPLILEMDTSLKGGKPLFFCSGMQSHDDGPCCWSIPHCDADLQTVVGTPTIHWKAMERDDAIGRVRHSAVLLAHAPTDVGLRWGGAALLKVLQDMCVTGKWQQHLRNNNTQIPFPLFD